MYGYEPPKQQESGSWAEVFTFSWVALQVVTPWLFAVLGGLCLVGLMLYFVTVNARLALIPLAVIGGGAWALILRDRRLKRELEERLGISEEDRL